MAFNLDVGITFHDCYYYYAACIALVEFNTILWYTYFLQNFKKPLSVMHIDSL